MITSAKYVSACASCGQTISKGTAIDYQDKVARHLVCPRYCPVCGKSPEEPGGHHKLACSNWRPRNP